MKRRNLLIVPLVLLHLSLRAQTDTIAQRIVLIGDAGQLTDGKHPVVDAVRKMIPLDKKTTVIFLGDNLYKLGLPDDQYNNYTAARAVLDSQLSVAENTAAKVYMIPGNHDWENGGRGGYDAILRQQLYVDFLKKPNIDFFPKDGCPGPKEISLGNDVTVILFDSQWWLHPYDKPGIESDCPCKTEDELVAQIQDIVARNAKKLVVLACHHPFKSNGIHGGFFTLKQHLFPLTDMKKNLYIPLPVLGSIYPIARSVFGVPQDIRHPNYTNMINKITAAVKEASRNVVFVSGHEHNLELIKDSSYNYIISGGGCKENRVSNSKRSPFISQSTGFSVMEVSTNKNVTVTFYTVTDSIRKVYNTSLLNFKTPEVIIDSAAVRVVDVPNAKYRDTITISASAEFPVVKGLKKFFIGQNYRPEWSTPVNMKVFHLDSAVKGGLSIVSLGGGKHTKALTLVDKTGKEWVLRSLNKSAANAMPEPFNNTLSPDILSDLNSASHPYAALAIPALAEPLKINVAHPKLYFVPDDPAFKAYQKLFANNVCILEEKNASPNGADTKSTAKLFDRMLDENDHRPEQEEVLQARLLDILIGDFDRHLDQWKWYVTDTGKGKIYHPIPRDRDQAFFYSTGAMVKILTGRSLPFLKGLKYNIPDIEWLGYSSKDFDRLFLTDLDEDEWKKAIARMQLILTDSVIRNAVNQMPKEIAAISNEKIIQKLISRRDMMGSKALDYYKFISKKVNIAGSNQKEYFKVSNAANGLQVKVYAISKGNDTSFIMYNRTFDPSVTKEIRLYGLNDDDRFEVEENVSSSIKLRIIGGKGNDTFNIKGHVENLLYDIKSDLNYIKDSSYSKNRFSKDPPVNDRSILGFNYNTTKFPQLLLNHNSDDGLLVGAGISKRTYGFRNLPYASDQRLSALYAVNRKALQFNYRGEFNHITRNLDLVVKANLSSPALRNFFGFGNNTQLTQSKDINFYRTRYKSFEMEALFRRRYFEKFHFMAGPYYYHYAASYADNFNTVLSRPSAVGLDSASIFRKKNYLGAKLALDFDNRNNELFPTRGVLWHNEFVSAAGLTKGSNNLMKFTSDMTIYASLNDPARIVGVLGIGGGRIFSNNYEYFQALTLGINNNNIHGFRKNRYAGKSLFYSSIELRMKLFDVSSYTLSGSFGLMGFYDIGRVKIKTEQSKGWHTAYGGGFYFIPFKLFVISATAGFSENERLLNFTIGTKINFTY